MYCVRIELGEREVLYKDRAEIKEVCVRIELGEKEFLCKDRTRRKGGFM